MDNGTPNIYSMQFIFRVERDRRILIERGLQRSSPNQTSNTGVVYLFICRMKLEIPSLDGEGNTTEIEAEDKLFLGKNSLLIYLLLFDDGYEKKSKRE